MKDNSYLISIVIPARNAAPYLKECIDSILAQEEKHWELFVVNDHSNDETYSILEAYQKIDTRIQVLNNKGKGIIQALRTAYAKCSGNLITRMDADDLMNPHKLKVLKENLISKGRGHLAVGGVRYFSEEALGNGYLKYAEWLNGLARRGDSFKEIFKECVIPSPCWMLYTSDFDALGGFEREVYPEDYDLCFRFFAFGLKVIPSNEILHLWRDHPTRASRTDPNYLDNRFFEIKADYFKKLFYDKGVFPVIWGSGPKGKLLAKGFQKRGITFEWVAENEKKIGKDIYDVRINHPSAIDYPKNKIVCIAVSNPNDQNEIIAFLEGKGMEKGKGYFLFC